MKRFLRPRNLIPVLGLLAVALGSAAPAAAQEISISDANPVVEGGNATFEVAVTNPGALPIPVAFSVSFTNGTAVAPGDYNNTQQNFAVMVPAGGAAYSVPVPTVNDNVYEPTQENFFANLINIVGATPGDTQGQGFINDNDPVPTYSINNVAAFEGNSGTTNFNFTVTLSNPSQLTTSIAVNTADGTATAADDPNNGTDNDYVPITGGTVTFTPGDVSETVTVQVRGDLNFEPNETFFVNLGPVTAGQANPNDPQGQGTILDLDPQPTIRIGDAQVVEGNAGTTTLSFPIFLEVNGTPVSSTQEIRVDAITLVGTGTSALPSSDYQPLNGEIVIAANTPSGAETVDVLVNGDFTPEADETLFVQLSNPENASLGDDGDTATGTIQNDDVAPTVSISDSTVAEGTGTGNQLTFTVTLSNPQQVVVTVPYSITDGTATSGTDFSAGSTGNLTFAPGQTSVTLTVNTVPDTNVEPNETFTVVLGTPTNATLADGSGLGTINNDDNVVGFSINDVNINEPNSGAANLEFTVTLSQARTSPLTVQYRTVDGTAVAGEDYTPAASGNLTFAPGVTTQTVSVPVLGDLDPESTENFTVELFNISDTSQANFIDATGVGTIVDTDLIQTITISDVTAAEGNSGSTNFAFTVTLSGPLTTPVTLQYRTVDGTAQGGVDYTPAAGGTLTFEAGTTTQTINVPVLGDLLNENNETFTVELFNLSNSAIAQIGDGVGLGTITNDDAVRTVSINDVTLTEGNAGSKNFAFTVTLSGALSSPVSVQYRTVDGSAAGGDDYAPVSGGTITFQPGDTTQTINVPVLGDLNPEGDETFTVELYNLSSPGSPAFVQLGDASGLGTIVNDDNGQAQITIADNQITEGDNGTQNLVFTVTLSKPLSDAISLQYSTNDGPAGQFGALGGQDYTPVTGGTLTFQPGVTSQTIVIPIIGDVIDERNETFTVVLSNLSNTTLATIADNTAVGTINDNDAAPTFSINDVTVCEDEGPAVFTITKSAVSGLPSTVTVNSNGLTATENGDFNSVDGTVVNFGPNELTKTVSVTINDDSFADNAVNGFDPETFELVLSNPVDATIADGTGVGTILDDEGLDVEIEEIPIDNQFLTGININGLARRCFRITVTNQCGDIVTDFGDDNGELLQVSIVGTTGSNTQVPVEITTDDEGKQIFCYTPLFDGEDEITVEAIVNGVVVDAETLLVTVDVDASVFRDPRISGSGLVDVGGRAAQFSLNAKTTTTRRRNGLVTVTNSGAVNVAVPFFNGNPFGITTLGTAQFRSTRIDGIVAGDATTGGHAAIIIGRGQVINGRRRFNVRYRVDVLDNGTPGAPNDRFVLSLINPFTGSTVSVGGSLKHGRSLGLKNDIKIDGPGIPRLAR